jgi:hypothetical protein
VLKLGGRIDIQSLNPGTTVRAVLPVHPHGASDHTTSTFPTLSTNTEPETSGRRPVHQSRSDGIHSPGT